MKSGSLMGSGLFSVTDQKLSLLLRSHVDKSLNPLWSVETFGLSTRKASWPGIPQVFPGRTVDIVFVLSSSGTLSGRNCGGK